MRTLAPGLLALLLATSAFAAADVFPQIFVPPRAVSGQAFDGWVSVAGCCHEQAQGGRLTLELPPELGVWAGEQCTTVGNVAECQLPALWAGNAILLHLTGTARAETTRTVTITATVTPQFPDSDPSNNTLRRDVLVLAEPDLNLYVSQQFSDYENTPVFAGEPTNIRAIVSNLGTEARDLHLRLRPHGAEIEAILGNGWDCSAAGPDSADCVRTSLPYGWGGEVVVRLKTNGLGAVHGTLEAELTSAGPDYSPNNDRVSLPFDVYRSIVVENAEDSGPGSLRNAIEIANAECAGGPCRIEFDLPPRADWYTIEPRTPLPAVTADGVILDARTQAGWVNANPRVALDGHLLESGDGLVLSSPCAFEVLGFAIGNFPGNGISATSAQLCTTGRKRIRENRIGSDPTGEWPWPNTRGIVASGKGIQIENNVVGGNARSGIVADGERIYLWSNIIGGLLPNGASGIYATPRANGCSILRNVIADNADMGIAIAREAQGVEVRFNSLRRNSGLGIDVGLDGRTPVRPEILGLTQTERETVVTVSVRQDAPFYLDFYANDGPDGEGERFIHTEFFSGSDGTPIEVRLGSFYSGIWITATAAPLGGTTTEMSDAVPVP